MSVKSKNAYYLMDLFPSARLPDPEDELIAADSAIHGMGIIAKRGFRAGDAIAKLSGKLMRGSEALCDPNYIGIGVDAWIDPDFPFSMINHHCEPSAAFGRRHTIYALCDILPGQEVTIDYSTTEVDPLWALKCECGSRDCRKMLRAIQFSFPDQASPPHASPLIVSIWRRLLRAQQAPNADGAKF